MFKLFAPLIEPVFQTQNSMTWPLQSTTCKWEKIESEPTFVDGVQPEEGVMKR